MEECLRYIKVGKDYYDIVKDLHQKVKERAEKKYPNQEGQKS